MAADPPDGHALRDPRVLVGAWALRRTLLDRRTGRRGCVHGTLTVVPVDAALQWTEEGWRTWDGQRSPVTRAYLVVPEGGSWLVRFADGRPFHGWAPGVPVVHDCGADRYTGLVDGGPGPDGALRWRVRWQVRGPAKDLDLRAVLRTRRGT